MFKLTKEKLLIFVFLNILIFCVSADISNRIIPPAVYRDSNLSELINKPKKIFLDIDIDNDEFYGKVGKVFVGYHYLADVKVYQIYSYFQDRSHFAETMPKLMEYDCQRYFSSEGNYLEERQRVGMEILGIDFSYNYLLHTVENYTDGEFYMRWYMIDSLDDKLANVYGQWYFKEVEVDGKTYSYISYCGETWVKKPPFGFSSIVKFTTSGGVKDNILTVEREAQRY